jgi:hypothetical protein
MSGGSLRLRNAFRSAGFEPSQDGNAISVAGKKILVEAGINNRAKKDGQHILAVEFHLNIDGAPAAPLTSGVVGIDANQEATRKTAIFEWAAQYGVPIAYAIAGQLGAGKLPRSDGSRSAPGWALRDRASRSIPHPRTSRTSHPGGAATRDFALRRSRIVLADLDSRPCQIR